MEEKENIVYKAKLAEQAERYEGILRHFADSVLYRLVIILIWIIAEVLLLPAQSLYHQF